MIKFKQFDEPYKLTDFVNKGNGWIEVTAITSHYAVNTVVWSLFYIEKHKTKYT